MSLRRRARARGRRQHGMGWAILLVILFCVICLGVYLAEHIAELLGVLVLVAGSVYAGRLYERSRAGRGPRTLVREQGTPAVTGPARPPRTPAGWRPPKLATLTPVMVSEQCRDGQACAICPGAGSGCQHDCGHEPRLIAARNAALYDADHADHAEPPF